MLTFWLTEAQLLALTSDLFIAGGETTITTLRWAILVLVVYPDVQERVREEIKANVGLDSPARYTEPENGTIVWTIRQPVTCFVVWMISATPNEPIILISKLSCTKCCASAVLRRECGGTRPMTPPSMWVYTASSSIYEMTFIKENTNW